MTITPRSRPDLVDLRALTDRWRVRFDARGADRALTPDPVPTIPGRRGHVEAFDLTTLCVYVTGRRFLLALLRALPAGWRRHQVGDDEANLLAPVADLDRAAEIVRAYRRRRLTPEQRSEVAARLGAARRAPVGGPFAARKSTTTAPDGKRYGQARGDRRSAPKAPASGAAATGTAQW